MKYHKHNSKTLNGPKKYPTCDSGFVFAIFYNLLGILAFHFKTIFMFNCTYNAKTDTLNKQTKKRENNIIYIY